MLVIIATRESVTWPMLSICFSTTSFCLMEFNNFSFRVSFVFFFLTFFATVETYEKYHFSLLFCETKHSKPNGTLPWKVLDKSKILWKLAKLYYILKISLSKSLLLFKPSPEISISIILRFSLKHPIDKNAAKILSLLNSRWPLKKSIQYFQQYFTSVFVARDAAVQFTIKALYISKYASQNLFFLQEL